MIALLARALALYLGAAPLYAQTVGANSAQLLSQGPGAEAAAEAGAVVSTVHDPTALYWNPAGLAEAGGEVSGEHLFLYGGARYDFVGLSVQSQVGSFGLGALQLYRGDIVARSAIDDPGSAVSNSQAVYMLGYARSLSEHWSAGVVGNVLDYNVAGYAAKGWGLDAGVQGHYSADDFLGLKRVQWSLGGAVKNLIQPQVTLMDTAEYYPRELRAGAAMSWETASRPQPTGEIDHDRATVLLALHQTAGDPGLGPAIGAAYDYLGILVFRAGYDGNVSGGVGFHLNDQFFLDYSMEDQPLALDYRFTISYRFAQPAGKPREIFREVIDDEYAEAKAQAESLAKESFASGSDLFRDQKYREAEEPFRLAALLTPDDERMRAAYRRAREAFRVQQMHRLSTDAILDPAPGQEEKSYLGLAELLELDGENRRSLGLKLHAAARRLPAERLAPLYHEVVDASTAAVRLDLSAGRLSDAQRVADALTVLVDAQDASLAAGLSRDVSTQAAAVRDRFEELSSRQGGGADLSRAALALMRAFPDDASTLARARAALERCRDENPLTIRESFYLKKLYYLAAAGYARRANSDLRDEIGYVREILSRDPSDEEADALLNAMVYDGLAR